MADWYVSSVAWTALSQWAALTAYTVGNIRRGLAAPAITAQHVFRCTTAGTSGAAEPTWTVTNNGTTNDGSAVWTCVSGQSTYGWGAAAGSAQTLESTRLAAGDREFFSSDHSQSSAGITFNGGVTSYSPIQRISVNRAGSVPPVAADILAGATIAMTTGGVFGRGCYWLGLTITSTSTLSIAPQEKAQVFKNCTLGGTSLVGSNDSSMVTLENTTMNFAAVGNSITTGNVPWVFEWINTAAPLPGASPTALFNSAAGNSMVATCRGLNLSALVTGKALVNYAAGTYSFYLFDGCTIDPAVSRVTGTPVDNGTTIELVNCWDGTNVVNERYVPAGSVVTERTIVMAGGATDGALFSHKMVSTVRLDKFVAPLQSFWLDVYNAVTGAQTATVEIISSGSLNNDEISLVLEYQPNSGSPFVQLATTLIGLLTTPAAVASSSVTWNASPATPVKQKLAVAFTALTAGRLRGQVRLGKASTTVYINPQMQVA